MLFDEHGVSGTSTNGCKVIEELEPIEAMEAYSILDHLPLSQSQLTDKVDAYILNNAASINHSNTFTAPVIVPPQDENNSSYIITTNNTNSNSTNSNSNDNHSVEEVYSMPSFEEDRTATITIGSIIVIALGLLFWVHIKRYIDTKKKKDTFPLSPTAHDDGKDPESLLLADKEQVEEPSQSTTITSSTLTSTHDSVQQRQHYHQLLFQQHEKA